MNGLLIPSKHLVWYLLFQSHFHIWLRAQVAHLPVLAYILTQEQVYRLQKPSGSESSYCLAVLFAWVSISPRDMLVPSYHTIKDRDGMLNKRQSSTSRSVSGLKRG